jgi:cellulose synthase (UDP-forming)
MPLTRRQLERDFAMIREMGANTIRRYDKSLYDKNILAVASEQGLNVQYGFWFDPEKDYYSDSALVNAYMEDVLARVAELKDSPAIIAWSLGNETWGLLKHHYAKPYLTLVRQSYIRMIGELAERVHAIDPTRPVFSCIEHEEHQIAGELVAFHDDAPAIDVMGVNSYYREQISRLNHVAWQFDSLRPYLVSEFGPRGYWDPDYNKTAEGALLEESDAEKAQWYRAQWNYYIQPFKGFNIGGFAYCWHDRMEGSCTWFGLTDFRGRPKPAYFALQEAWTGNRGAPCVEATIRARMKAVPGTSCMYTAEVKTTGRHRLRYEWYLHKNDFLQRVDGISYVNDGRAALVNIPTEPSAYRLYLYVTDESGRVSTASFPIPVSNKNMP